MSTKRNWFAKHTLPLWKKHLLPLAPFQRYLELGVYAGDSLVWAAQNLVDSAGESIGVDPYDHVIAGRTFNEIRAIRREVKERIRVLAPICLLFEATSCEFLAEPNGDFDLVYVDGNHAADAALTDMVLSWRVLRPGGIMVVDDVHLRYGLRGRTRPEVYEAWMAFSSCYTGQFTNVYIEPRQVAVKKTP